MHRTTQTSSIWDLTLPQAEATAIGKGSGLLAQYKSIGGGIYAAMQNKDKDNVYQTLKTLKDRITGETVSYATFYQVNRVIVAKRDDFTLSDCIELINALEVQLHLMWHMNNIKDVVQGGLNDPNIPEIEKIFIANNHLKKTIFAMLREYSQTNPEDRFPKEGDARRAFDNIMKNDVGVLHYEISEIIKGATKKITDTIAGQVKHVNVGVHTYFNTISDLFDSRLLESALNEDKLLGLLINYQKNATDIMRESTHEPFLIIIAKITASIREFIESHQFLYKNSGQYISMMNAIEAQANFKINELNKEPVTVVGVFNTIVYGGKKVTMKESSLEGQVNFYDPKLMKDFQENVFLEFKHEAASRLAARDIEMKKEAKKGDVLKAGASKGVDFVSESVLGEIPFLGKALAGGASWLGNKVVDKVTDKIYDQLDRKALSDSEIKEFTRFISNDRLNLESLSAHFVACLYATFPDAFKRIQPGSIDNAHIILNKMISLMLMMMPYYTKELMAALNTDHTDARKYKEMGMLLVDAFVEGCKNRIFIQALIKNWKVPYITNVKDGTIESVELFDIFTKCALVATRDPLDKRFDKNELLIIYAPDKAKSDIDIVKYGVGFTSTKNECFTLGFLNSCLRKDPNKESDLRVGDTTITYDSVSNSLKGHADPYFFSAIAVEQFRLSSTSTSEPTVVEKQRERREAVTQTSRKPSAYTPSSTATTSSTPNLTTSTLSSSSTSTSSTPLYGPNDETAVLKAKVAEQEATINQLSAQMQAMQAMQEQMQKMMQQFMVQAQIATPAQPSLSSSTFGVLSQTRKRETTVSQKSSSSEEAKSQSPNPKKGGGGGGPTSS